MAPQARTEATAASLVAAALEVVAVDGMKGATARAIAGRAGCNQALVFYHFGSVEGLLVAALKDLSQSRREALARRIGQASGVGELSTAMSELMVADRSNGQLSALVSLIEGSRTMPQLRTALEAELLGWRSWVTEVMTDLARQHHLEALVPQPEAAQAMMALVVGLELLGVVMPGAGDQVVRAMVDTLSPLLGDSGDNGSEG